MVHDRARFSTAFQVTALVSAVALGALFALTEHSIRRNARAASVIHASLGPESLAPRAPARTDFDAGVRPIAQRAGVAASREATTSVPEAAPVLSSGPTDAVAPTLPGSDTRCPAGSVLVEGEYCPNVVERCLEWTGDDRRRCLRFAQPMWCRGGRRHMAFCIDRYEWPNQRGARPAVMVTWLEADEMCRNAGRRLCTQDEWTFACEGEQMLPYGYGFDREPDRCTVDHFAAAPNTVLLDSPRRDVALGEAERVYEAGASGSMARCTTPFGAYDLVGNVDEWTVNESGWPFRSALKGGWWGRIRGRCRPATLAHYERFRYYQIGFRCCADDAAAAARAPPETAHRGTDRVRTARPAHDPAPRTPSPPAPL